ncbi:hypothetical protein V6N13_090769 [Hibiscus sabdariffa]|uniref:RNase H type-1 domain-containing protein n=1 Tax=Hibiscus sabdariffa TaxID=183260 RepID=A0ABR2BPF3_9ROSI
MKFKEEQMMYRMNKLLKENMDVLPGKVKGDSSKFWRPKGHVWCYRDGWMVVAADVVCDEWSHSIAGNEDHHQAWSLRLAVDMLLES